MSDKEPLNPTAASEAVIERITDANGRVLRDRYCEICKPAMVGTTKMVPYHDASRRCQSGGRQHCSCDTCF